MRVIIICLPLLCMCYDNFSRLNKCTSNIKEKAVRVDAVKLRQFEIHLVLLLT
jgi:hypothetical protein